MNSATSKVTIQHLRTVFAQFGIPDSIVMDNGTCFTSAEFEEFWTKNGISHKSTPYHPATNGMAERAVQILKQGLKKNTEGCPSDRIAKLLFMYRRTPHSATGVSLAKLLIGRDPKLHLDLLKPDISHRVEAKQQQQKSTHDSHAHARQFSEGEEVYIRKLSTTRTVMDSRYNFKSHWPSPYQVELENSQIIHRHQDHVRKRMAVSEELTVPNLDVLPQENDAHLPIMMLIVTARMSQPIAILHNHLIGGIPLAHVNLLIGMNRTLI